MSCQDPRGGGASKKNRPAVGGRTDTVSTTWPDVTHFAPKLERASAVPREVSSTRRVYTISPLLIWYKMRLYTVRLPHFGRQYAVLRISGHGRAISCITAIHTCHSQSDQNVCITVLNIIATPHY